MGCDINLSHTILKRFVYNEKCNLNSVGTPSRQFLKELNRILVDTFFIESRLCLRNVSYLLLDLFELDLSLLLFKSGR